MKNSPTIDHQDDIPHFGTLYAVSTPIGNLEDITLRALKILKNVDVIAAENVTHTRGLCTHYDIRSRLTHYSQHNRYAKTPELIGRLKSGFDIALVTDAGTPGISDPGVHLINRALEENVKVSPVPSLRTGYRSVCILRIFVQQTGQKKTGIKKTDHRTPYHGLL